MTDQDRFWAKVDKSGECWLWTASTTRGGYGQFSLHRPDGGYGPKRAHRIAYQWMVGPIPAGMTIDHLCRDPRCVRPDHLEPVTNAENIRRSGSTTRLASRQRARTHCKHGHEFSPANTYEWRGHRHCRACGRRNVARYEGRLTQPFVDAGFAAIVGREGA